MNPPIQHLQLKNQQLGCESNKLNSIDSGLDPDAVDFETKELDFSVINAANEYNQQLKILENASTINCGNSDVSEHRNYDASPDLKQDQGDDGAKVAKAEEDLQVAGTVVSAESKQKAKKSESAMYSEETKCKQCTRMREELHEIRTTTNVLRDEITKLRSAQEKMIS